MSALNLHELHQQLGAVFSEMNGAEMVAHYGDVAAEHAALRGSTGVLDLGFRSRLCLLGADRKSFLNGQVTNNVKDLAPGSGCYAALVTAKGKMQSDLLIYCLQDEILLDFEPGLSGMVQQRLEKYIIAEDVQVVSVADAYGHLSIQGPESARALAALALSAALPEAPMKFVQHSDPTLGDIYVMNHPRTGTHGFDLFVPTAALGAVLDKLVASARALGGRVVGWAALEQARIEAAIPRFGADMDETNPPPEAGLEGRAIHYAKGCYIGQEVIARIRTYGQVAKALRGLQWAPESGGSLPKKGDKIFWGEKEVGYVTSATASTDLGSNLALGYLRREQNQVGAQLVIRTDQGPVNATVTTLPFQPFAALPPFPALTVSPDLARQGE